MRHALVLTLVVLVGVPVFGQPAESDDKADATPDFLQTDPGSGFAESGSQFCAPASVSNSLMYLADHGYGKLRPQAKTAKEAQAQIIRTLGSSEYMNTNPSIGTSPSEVTLGVRKYLQEHGCAIERLEYQGWRPGPDGNEAEHHHPDLRALKQVLANPRGAVWLNVGWYTHDAESDEYARDGGHWVTAVGYRGDTLLVHDPSPRAGAEAWTQDVTVGTIASGELTGDNKGLPQPAAGYLRLGGEMSLPERADTCILDGVVLLVLGGGHGGDEE